jgi:hypothetical protein
MFRLPLSRWVVFFVASGFGLTTIDVWHSHHFLMETHLWAWAPCGFAPAACVLVGLAGIVWRVPLLRVVQVVGLLGMIVGSVGFVFHNLERFASEGGDHQGHSGLLERTGLSGAAWAHEEEASQPTPVSPPHAGAEGAHVEPPPSWIERFYADRHPPLAPLTFAGLGFLGFLASAFGVRRLQNPATQSGTQPVSEE